MRTLILSATTLALFSSPAWGGPGGALHRCQKDDQCRFAFRDPCERRCPPCGEAWRKADTRKAYQDYQRVWAIKVPACPRCKKSCQTRWRGDRAVCKKGRCVVVEKGPLPLKSYVNARLGAQVYRVKMRWMDSMGQFVPADRIAPPRHYAAALRLYGAQKPGARSGELPRGGRPNLDQERAPQPTR